MEMLDTLEESVMNDFDPSLFEAVLIGAADPEIVACEAHIRAAQLASDVPALDRLISDDLLFAGPDGQLWTKANDLYLHGAGTIRFHRHEPEELRIRRVGAGVAVVSLRTWLSVTLAGILHEGTFQYTRIWAREGGAPWSIVGGHVSAIPPDGQA